MSTIKRIKPPRPRCDAAGCVRPAYGDALILTHRWSLAPGDRANLCLGHFYGIGSRLEEGLGHQFLETLRP